MAMAAIAEQRTGIERPAISRFELGDLPKHGAWLVPRLVAALELPEQRLGGWLRSLIDSNEHLFLVQEHSVALAEMQRANGLADKPIIKERFVFAEDRENAAHVKEAAEFYDNFKRWAKDLGAEVIIVQELSDVPADMIKDKLGRIFNRTQQFARV
jgi:hypothetical protein